MSTDSTPVATTKAKAPKAKKQPKGKAPKGKKVVKAKGKGKKERAPRAKKEGLRKPQIRILQCLMRNKAPLTRAQIAEKAPVDLAMLNSYIGSHNDEIRAKNDKLVMPSLRTLGFVKVEQDIAGHDGIVHTITAAGRKALEKALVE